MIKPSYTAEFEKLWSSHTYGNKKLAFDQCVRQKFVAADYQMVAAYLERRWKDDADWAEGKVHHLRTILSQRHWETDNYKKKKPSWRERVKVEPKEPYRPPPTEAEIERGRMTLSSVVSDLERLH